MTINALTFNLTRHARSGLSIILVTLLLMAAGAHAESINVESSEGNVVYRINDNAAWQKLEAGMALNMPVDIKTAADSRAVIAQAGSTFTIKSNSRFTLHGDNEEPGGLITRIKQWFGTVFYDVERQPDTFSVETPFLVSTVKGTKFVIVSTDTSSYVTLNEGRLEVQDVRSGATNIINAGDIAGSSATSSGVKTMNQTPASGQARTPPPASPQTAGAAISDDSESNTSSTASRSGHSFDNALSGINEDATVQQTDMTTDNDISRGDYMSDNSDVSAGDDPDSGADMGIGNDTDTVNNSNAGGDEMDSGDDINAGSDDMHQDDSSGSDNDDLKPCGNGLCGGNDKPAGRGGKDGDGEED